MHVVGPVGDAQRPGVCPHAREREVLRHTAAAVHLDRAVDDVEAHARSDDLDRGDLTARALGADGVDHPRGVERVEPRLVDLHP